MVFELIGFIPYSFVWWYTDGVSRIFFWIQQRLQFLLRSLSFRFWISHLFDSMYGQHDFVGKAISIFMRFVVLIWRVFELFFFLVFAFLMLCTWFIFPACIIGLALYNIYV